MRIHWNISPEFLQNGNLLNRSYQSTVVQMACHTGSNWMNENFYLLHKYYGSTHFLCVQSGIKHHTSMLFAMYRSEKCFARKVSGLVLCFASMRPLPLLYMLIDGHTCSQCYNELVLPSVGQRAVCCSVLVPRH